jgi:hypothetical protein
LKSQRFVGLVCLVLFLGLAGAAARIFPPVNTDEVVAAVRSWNLASGRGSWYSLYDDVFDPRIDEWRDVFPDIGRTVFNAWTGPWMRAGRGGYWAGRLSSVAAGAAALFLMFLLLRNWRWGGLALSVTLAAAAHPVFFLASLVIRPEILLAAASMGGLALVEFVPARIRWKRFLVGCWMGLWMGIHANAAACAAGVWVFWLIRDPEERRAANVAAVLAGGIAAGFFLVAVTDMDRLVAGLRLMFGELLRPPLFQDPWHPWRWLAGPARLFWRPDSFYLKGGPAELWRTGTGLIWLVWIGLAVTAFRRSADPGTRRMRIALAAGAAAWWVVAAALMHRPEGLYGIQVFPFLIPLACLGLSGIPGVARRAVPALLVAGGVFVIAVTAVRERPLYMTEPEVTAAVERLLPSPEAKILGPNRLWFHFRERFRDAGALMYSRWFTGGIATPKDCLERWRPDVVVADETFRKLFLGAGDPAVALSARLRRPVFFLGVVDTGSAGDGPWQVLRVFWEREGRLEPNNENM